MEINSGFSTREQLVSSITGEELTTNPAPTVSTSGMNPMNSPQGTFAYNNNMVNRPMASSLLLTGSRFGLDADNNSNLSPAASNRAARKNRLAQQRQALVSCNVSQVVSPLFGLWIFYGWAYQMVLEGLGHVRATLKFGPRPDSAIMD
jgi:hypothetical protein